MKNKLNLIYRIGFLSNYSIIIYKYLTIALVLTIITGITAGIGGILGIMYFNILLKIFPFKISLFLDYKRFISKDLDFENLSKSWNKKVKYTIILLSVILLVHISLFSLVENRGDFYAVVIMLLLNTFILSPQIIFLFLIKKNIMVNLKNAI